MAAHSGKQFQDLLCEGRAHSVETTDPVAAKVIDELKKQVAKQKAEIDVDKVNLREVQRNHEKEVRSIRDQAEKKLEKSLEALSRHKDDEKVTEVSQVKERLLKQNQHELRTQRAELEDEMRRLERRLTREREESMRKILDFERKKTEQELSHYLPEDSVMTREEHLKAEIFRLGEEVERVEFQMINLQRENRDQINTMKRMKHEHKIEVESLMKKNQSEAARDLAQLKLAEQIIQEKERHIQEEEYRVDIVVMEKEALVEELVHVRSHKSLQSLTREEAVKSPTAGKRASILGGGLLHRRVEELEGTLKKLDEERRQLKQENASLRKAAVKEGDGEGKGAEEKLKRLRKRNAELVALARQLDEKTKSLKAENEQLQKQSVSSSVGGSGGGGAGEKGKGGGGESDVRRTLSRQHAKDISEYTKQILAKDRELDSLRKRLGKYEVDGKARYEAAPDMEKRLRSMAMERLKMEKVMVQLYSKVSNPLDVGVITKREMEGESRDMERLFDDNKSLRDKLELLKSQARMEDVDHSTPSQSSRDRLHKQHSLPSPSPKVGGGGGAGGGEKEQELAAENTQLQARISVLAKCESEVGRLKAVLQEVEAAKTSYEQQNRRLTQQLRDTQQLAQEMDAVQEQCVELEKEVAEVKGQLGDRDTKIKQLEVQCRSATESLSDTRQEADSLRGKVAELEVEVREKQLQIRQLATELDQQQPAAASDVGLQTSFNASPEKTNPSHPTLSPQSTKESPSSRTQSHPPPTSVAPSTSASDRRVKSPDRPSNAGERRVKSAGKSRRIKSPSKRTSATGSGCVEDADVSLDNEMRLAGYDLTDPYDSSEGVAFSDTNLDGSSMLSFDDEGTREGGESTMSTRSPGSGREKGAVVEEEQGSESRTLVEEGSDVIMSGGGGGGGGGEGSSVLDEGTEGVVPESVATSSPQQHSTGEDSLLSNTEHVTQSREKKEEEESPGEEGEKLFTHVQVLGFGKEGKRSKEEVEGGEVEDLEGVVAEESGGENVSASSSDTESQALKEKDSQQPELLTSDTVTSDPATSDPATSDPATSDPATSTTTAPNTVSVYIAKYSYVPDEMSPNPSHDQELTITAGDYLYVFGEMDDDGFYFAQLMNGENGMVPSNFVEKVDEGEEEGSAPRPGRFGTRQRRVSDLQDIPEVDEDISTSSSGSGGLPSPPSNLELEKMFVEGDKYSVVIQWSSPPSLPQDSHVTYHIYVNRVYKETVEGSAGTMSAHLRDIPRQQLVKISVRTVTNEGESADPKKLIILNPQYPEPPTAVQIVPVEEEPPSSQTILVQWTPSQPVEGGSPISSYIILLNNSPFMQLQCNDIPTDTVYAKLLPSDLRSLKLVRQERLILTVRAVSEHYQSVDSLPVEVTRELLDQVVVAEPASASGKMLGGGETDVLESSHSSVGSSEPEEREVYSPAHHTSTSPGGAGRHVTQTVGVATRSDSHSTSESAAAGGVNEPDGQATSREQPSVNGPTSTNGAREPREGGEVDRKPIIGEQYYTAMFSYNPAFHSPNEETVEDELVFREGDIITAISEIDEEGFFEGMLRGQKGLVPSNMVELVTDPEKLENIPQLLADQLSRSPDPLCRLPTVNGGTAFETTRRMRAVYPYNPITDSPNDNTEDELTIQEGDVITVFGRPDDDGYYQGELNGKRGLVPSNFLEEFKEEGKEGGVERGRVGSVGTEIFAASEQDMEQAKRLIAEASDSLRRSGSLTATDKAKHKKGILSKGKNFFSKGGVGKK